MSPWSNLVFLFFVCLGAAIWLVYLFCQKKFSERSTDSGSDYVYQLLPEQLATHEEYSKGFFIYFGSMAATVALLSIIGRTNLGLLGISLSKDADSVASDVITPLAIAFMVIGALPTVPGLTMIEKYLREYAQKRAYIPDAARATADRLAAADFDFASYAGDALQSPEMRGVEPGDFKSSRRTIEYSWARLCCLVYLQKSCRVDGQADWLDANLLRNYEQDLDHIESQKKAMESEVAAYRVAKAGDPYYTNEPLWQAIRANLCKLHILLGCAVRHKKQPCDDIDLALETFGFRLNHPTKERETGDIKVISLFAIAASTTLLGLAAMAVGQIAANWFDWQLSEVFPTTVSQPFMDTVSTLIPHATAIIVADALRRRAIEKGSWFAAWGGRRRANFANHVRVAFLCGLAGYVSLVLWGLTVAAPTNLGFKIEMPNALLAMATASFYLLHLDNVELGRRPSRAWELAPQTLITGLCGLIAASCAWQMVFGSVTQAIDRILLTAAVSATVGFVFAWYIPYAAATRNDPLVEAIEDRIRILEAAALAHFGNAAEATAWLAKGHPALGNRSPRSAATELEGYERAIALLHGPQPLAA